MLYYLIGWSKKNTVTITSCFRKYKKHCVYITSCCREYKTYFVYNILLQKILKTLWTLYLTAGNKSSLFLSFVCYSSYYGEVLGFFHLFKKCIDFFLFFSFFLCSNICLEHLIYGRSYVNRGKETPVGCIFQVIFHLYH